MQIEAPFEQNKQKNLEQLRMQRSPNDNRQFQFVTLANNMSVLLISDSSSHKSACSISVGIGSLHDPPQAQGLAHFLEHMVFMGSAKYPSHTQYAQFISLNSGYENAFTQDDQTNFYFEVSHHPEDSIFYQALSRLSDFLKAASLNVDCIKKQTQAVHEQFVLQMNDDECRRQQIIKKLAKGAYANFSLGNNSSLDIQGEKLRQLLFKFYNQHYSADMMAAVLYSNESIEQMIRKYIGPLQQIPNKKHKQVKYDIPFPFKEQGSNTVPKLIRVQSIFNQQILDFFWVIDHLPIHDKYHVKDYLTYVLNFDSQNSLQEILHHENYAQQIKCESLDLRSQTLINLTITLTTKGKCSYEKVYNIVLDYVAQLRADRQIYEQLKHIKQIEFQFSQRQELQDEVTELSSTINKFTYHRSQKLLMCNLLKHKSMYLNFDSEVEQSINNSLKQLKHDNLIVVFSNDDKIKEKTVSIDQHFRTRYLIKNPIPRKITNTKFKKVQKSKYCPINTQLVYSQIKQKFDTPQKLSTKRKNKVYYFPDQCFNACKAGIRVLIHLPHKTKYSYNFLKMYADFLQESFSQITSQADQLSVETQFNTIDCLAIDIYGYSDIVKKLIFQIGSKLMKIHEQRNEDTRQNFQIAKDSYVEDWQNFDCDQISDVAEDMLEMILKQNRQLSPQDMAEQAEKMKFKNFIQLAISLWGDAILEWIVVGNLKKQQVMDMVQHFESVLPPIREQRKQGIQPIRCLKLTEKTIKYEMLLDDADIKTSCCLVYYQAGIRTEKLFYLVQMVENYLSEPFFNQLRTQQQLAYQLSINTLNTRGVLGVYFLLVSSNKDPQHISKQIKIFIRNFLQKSQRELTESRFEQLKKSVINKHLTKHLNLQETYEFISQEIENRTFYFKRKQFQQLNKHLSPQNISRNNFLSFMNQIFQKSLEILIVSKVHQKIYKSHRPKYFKFEDIKKRAQYFEDNICKKI